MWPNPQETEEATEETILNGKPFSAVSSMNQETNTVTTFSSTQVTEAGNSNRMETLEFQQNVECGERKGHSCKAIDNW